MNVRMCTTLEEFAEKLEQNLDGYFELYKNAQIKNVNKEIDSYSQIIDMKLLNEKVKCKDFHDAFFLTFLCLMMRYTQNDLISGISLRDRQGSLSVLHISVLYDIKLTFQSLTKILLEESTIFSFGKDQFCNVKNLVANYASCIFVFHDEGDTDIYNYEQDMSTDICFCVSIFNENAELKIIYDKNAYENNFICNMVCHYNQLLMYLLADGHLPIYKAPYLDLTEKKILIDVWNHTDFPYLEKACLHQLFEQRVMEDSEAIALYYEGSSMSRSTLNKRANQLAHCLLQFGVKVGDIVALYSNKSINYVIGILGILKAGGAYLPIDESYPETRIEYILSNSETKIMVAAVDMEDRVTHVDGLTIIDMGRVGEKMENYLDSNPEVKVTSEDPCYLIYTSGSTGKPKGVLLNHKGRVNNFSDFNSRFLISYRDTVLAVSSVSFDMSAYDILGSLIAGSRIVLPDPLLAKQPFHWLDLIQKYEVTIWHSVPTLLELLCKCCRHRNIYNIDSIRLVLLGGDWIPLSLPGDFRTFNQKAVLVSLGGATEVSMDSTIFLIGDIDINWKSIPYGKPMRNQKAYILDKNRELLPTGIPGELYLGGIGVGEGYYLDPDATKERFFKNPWDTDPNQKIYKTGDLAYFQADGNLILLGRMDYQIKLNGVRIELGEIEHNLINYEGISKAVAIAPQIGLQRKIVVYVEYQSGQNIPQESELINYLLKLMPKTHIPSHIILTNTIPITPNGKVDRKMLEESVLSYINHI